MKTPPETLKPHVLPEALRKLSTEERQAMKAAAQAEGRKLAEAIAANLNRHTSSEAFLRRRARYENPKATDAEIDALVAAERARLAAQAGRTA